MDFSGVETARERHALKAAAHAALPQRVRMYRSGRDVLRVEEGPALEDGLLRVVLSLSRDGIIVSLDNPFYFQNPPVMVDDPAGGVVVHTVHPVTKIVTERRLREDVEEAFRIIVMRAAGIEP